MQPIDALVRKVFINGAPVMDARLVVTVLTAGGLGVLIARPGGVPTVISRMINPTLAREPGGIITATDGLNTWSMQTENRCGTCAGRYELSRIVVGPLIDAAFAEPEPLPAGLADQLHAAPAYGDTY